MIRLLVKLASWLDTRYPAKAVVKVKDYEALLGQVGGLQAELGMLRTDLDIAKNGIDALSSRLGSVESNAVHKGAVQDLVHVVRGVKEDVESLKVNLGFSRLAEQQKMTALLNGEFLPEEPTQNG